MSKGLEADSRPDQENGEHLKTPLQGEFDNAGYCSASSPILSRVNNLHFVRKRFGYTRAERECPKPKPGHS